MSRRLNRSLVNRQKQIMAVINGESLKPSDEERAILDMLYIYDLPVDDMREFVVDAYSHGVVVNKIDVDFGEEFDYKNEEAPIAAEIVQTLILEYVRAGGRWGDRL